MFGIIGQVVVQQVFHVSAGCIGTGVDLGIALCVIKLDGDGRWLDDVNGHRLGTQVGVKGMVSVQRSKGRGITGIIREDCVQQWKGEAVEADGVEWVTLDVNGFRTIGMQGGLGGGGGACGDIVCGIIGQGMSARDGWGGVGDRSDVVDVAVEGVQGCGDGWNRREVGRAWQLRF